MAIRDVELIIKARDQASQIAKTVGDAFDRLSTAETKVGTASDKAGDLIARLATELAQLQATAGGLSAFSRVSGQIDRAGASVTRLQTNLARAQDAFVQTSLRASQTATNLGLIEAEANSARTALAGQEGVLSTLQAELARTNAQVAQAGARYRQLTGELRQTKAPSDALKQSVRDQRDALISLVEQQLRQTNALAAQQQVVRTAAATLNTLEKEAGQTATQLRRVNIEFEKTAIAARNESQAVEIATNEYQQLQAAATAASASLGGVALKQDDITAAARRNADAISRVTLALAQQQARASQSSGQAAASGPAAQATAALRSQIAAVEQTRAAWKAAEGDAARLAVSIRNVAQPTAAMRAEFTLATIAARTAKDEFRQQEAALRGMRAGLQFVQTAFQPFTASARAAALAQTQTSAASLTLIQRLSLLAQRLIGIRAPAQQATAALNAATTAAARANAANPNQAFLGLTPSRLQNLSFQINDVITQLASGTSVQQTLAQQAAQIGQLFPKFNNLLISGLRLLPVLAAIGVVLSPIIAAFINLGNTAKSIREFNTVLAATGDSARISSRELANTARAIDEYGGSLEDAIAIEREFLTQGIAIDHMEDLANAATNVGRAFGIEATEAATKFTRAINGSLDDVLSLDREINFLTASERERIRALNESTDATTRDAREAEQRQIVYEALIRQSDQIAANSRGPWSQAFRTLGQAFNDVVRAFENTGIIQALGRQFDELGQKVNGAAQNFRVGFAFLTGGRQGLVRLAERQQADRASGDPRDPDSAVAQRAAEARAAQQREFNRELDRTLERRQLEVRLSGASREAAAGERAVFDLQNDARRAGVTLTQEQISATRTAAEAEERARAGRRQGISDTNSLIRRQREFNLDLERENAQRALQIRLLGMTARQAAVESAIEQARIRAAERRVEITDRQIEQIRESAEALFDAQQAETQRNELLQMEIELRGILIHNMERVSVEQQIQEEAQLRNIDLTTQYGQAWSAMRTRVIEATRSVEDLREAQSRVGALAQNLRNMERDFRTARENGETRAQLAERMEALEEQRRLLVEARDAAIQLAEALGDEEALERLRATNSEIRVQREETLSTADANRMLADMLTQAIDKSAEQIALAIDGTQDWGDALTAIGDIFRQFASDFLRQIANMIIQQLILNALQSSGFGGAVSGAVNAVTRHGGGMAGSGGPRRRVDPRIFVGARKFHGGGVAGLTKDEVPAILKRGEEVLTAADPRHVANGGQSGGGVNVRNVNVFDATEVLQQALSRSGGEKVILNYVRENPSAFRSALGV